MTFQWWGRIGALAVLVLSTGCASVTGGNTQKMYVQVNDTGGKVVDGANCVLSNDKGTWNLKAPTDTTVTRSNKAMDIACVKPGLPKGSVNVDSATRAAMYGNILIGGVIGAVIDHTSGAAYEYPGITTVVMGAVSTVKMDYTAGKAGSGGPTAVPRTVPAASGFADINDVAVVPVTDAGKESYRKFLAKPPPRAFVLADGPHFQWANGLRPSDSSRLSDPAERALGRCRDSGALNCRLYAVDNVVVYIAPKTVATAAPPAQVMQPAANASTPLFAAIVSSAVDPTPLAHRYQMPQASSFADIRDSTSVPTREDGHGRYLQFLASPKPRAFAVDADGNWYVAENNTAAMAEVLNACERAGKTCWLYAVDDVVVWQTEMTKRLARASQLVLVQAN